MKMNEFKNKKNPGNQIPCHSSYSAGIICGLHRESCALRDLAVQFRDHFRSGDHLRSGIICSAVHCGTFAQNMVVRLTSSSAVTMAKIHEPI